MTISNFSLPMRCISYYASSKSGLDGKQSYEFWLRGVCIRIVCDKPFARGDVIEIQSIEDTNSGVLITTKLIDEWEQEYPVLNFISGRLIYNRWAEFQYETTDGIQIIKPIEHVLNVFVHSIVAKHFCKINLISHKIGKTAISVYNYIHIF